MHEFYDDGHTKVGPHKNTGKLEKVELKDNYMLVGAPGCTHCFRRSLFNLAEPVWFDDYPHDALLWRTALFTDSLYFYTDDLIRWRKHSDSAFARDSRNKTKANKEKWLDYDLQVADGLEKIISSFSGDTTRQQDALTRNRRWISLRKKFLSSSEDEHTKETRTHCGYAFLLFQKLLRIVIFLNRESRTLLNLSEYLADIFTNHAQTD